MPTLAAHGIAVDAPSGWDGQIFRRDPDPLPDQAVSRAPMGAQASDPTPPIAHVANFALPPQRGDFGGGAVELMSSGAIFISLLEHPPEEAATALFAAQGVPWPLKASDFAFDNLQRGISGQLGLQRFFVVDGRPFCLYVVLGSSAQREVLVREVNRVLASVRFT